MTLEHEIAGDFTADELRAIVNRLCATLQQRVTDAPPVNESNLLQIVEGVISVAAQRTGELEKARQENRDLRELIRRVV